MKAILFLFLSSLSLFAQDKTKFHYLEVVESYYDNTTDRPIYIYDSTDGNIVDTLYNVDDKYAWYKIAISESDYGWFKIKNIQRLPSSYKDFDYEDYWVRTSGFLININSYDDSHYVYIYDLPSTEANKIHKLDRFQRVYVTEIDGKWSKVKFKVGNKVVEGWLGFKDQCAYPWTTCPKYE
ncbi:SH3 domain-containing protein [Psychroserpens sp. MEBiC05023]